MAMLPPELPVMSLILMLLLILHSVSADSVAGGGICGGEAEPGSCPVKCFRADPVCGDDGVTYWCGCTDALCNGARVSKGRACDVGNGVSMSVPGQALLLVHIVWLILLGFSMLLGLF